MPTSTCVSEPAQTSDVRGVNFRTALTMLAISKRGLTEPKLQACQQIDNSEASDARWQGGVLHPRPYARDHWMSNLIVEGGQVQQRNALGVNFTWLQIWKALGGFESLKFAGSSTSIASILCGRMRLGLHGPGAMLPRAWETSPAPRHPGFGKAMCEKVHCRSHPPAPLETIHPLKIRVRLFPLQQYSMI